MSHLSGKKRRRILSKERKKYFSRLFIFKAVFSFAILSSLLFLVSSSSSAAELTDRKVIVSDSRKNTSNIAYNYDWTGSTNNLKCFKVLFCTTWPGGCTVPNGLDITTSAKGSWSGLTVEDWTLNNSTNGILELTNSVGEMPATNLVLEFLGITNPTSRGNYFNRITTYSDESCSTEVDAGNVSFQIVESGVAITAVVEGILPPGGGGVVNYATIVFKGKAYPGAFLTLSKNKIVSTTFLAESSGIFTKELTGIAGGIYTFGFFAEDTDGRKSPTLNFTISIFGGTKTKISGIFLAPTISLRSSAVMKGGNIDLSGQVFPESKINLFIYPEEMVKVANASGEGKWNYSLNTSILEVGQHEIKSIAISQEGEQSPFSQTLSFSVLEQAGRACNGADLNFDGKVNVVDFSILLHFWKATQPRNNCVDINLDGIVDVIDFSIMMHQWS